MIFVPFTLKCLAHHSYLIGDAQTRTAWVFDPQRDIDHYLAAAREHGLTITDVALTHLHADFVAGHLELRDRVGARIHLGAQARVDYPCVPTRDGDTHRLGTVRFVAWHTPGHTPEGITWLVYDDAQGQAADPVLALTGDTLFVGDVGRPDLLVGAGLSAGELAGALYDSVQRLLSLSDAVRIHPAHGAGSLCGRALGAAAFSTIGSERQHNYALQPQSREAFIAAVTADQPPAPAYFAHDVAMNRGERVTTTAATPRLSVDAAATALAATPPAQILDVRPAGDFAASHWRGAIQVGLDGAFAQWAGAVLDASRPIVLIAEPARSDEAVLRLRRIGFDRVAGILDGGMASLAARPDLIAAIPRLTGAELRHALHAAQPPSILDVRNPDECQRTPGIPGAVAIPLSQLPSRLSAVPRGRPIVVHCAGGYRSMIAASVLAAHGFQVSDLIGGLPAWQSAST